MILKTKNIEFDTDGSLHSVNFLAGFIEDMQYRIDDIAKNYYMLDEWTPICKEKENGAYDLENMGVVETKYEDGTIFARFKKYNKEETLYEPALEDGMVL